MWGLRHTAGRRGRASEERQQLLLKAVGLRHRALLAQLASAQDHRIEVAVKIEGPLETQAQIVGSEGVGGTLIHGAGGAEPGSG